ncbi:hypothetical protein [Shewanella algae]|uniref:hypothetical protein n=1 Tax=Shewanella algae TaxID=38313 RepID=UPI0031F57CE6
MSNKKIRRNSWDGIGDEVLNRLGNAVKSLIFIAFFSVGVIFVGGIGIWLPAILDSQNTKLFESQNVFTYSVAILGTLFVESFLSGNNKSFAALGLIVGVFAFLICCLGYYFQQKGVSLWLNFGAVLALILFLMANVNNDLFDDEDEKPKTDATGYNEASAVNIKDKSDE